MRNLIEKPLSKKLRKHEHKALLNLDNKISVIRLWSENGVPQKRDLHGNLLYDGKTRKPQLEFFPTSLTTFAKWSSDKISDINRYEYVHFNSHSKDTLLKDEKKHSEVIFLIEALKYKAKSQTSKKDLVDEITSLKAEIEAEKKLRQLSEITYLKNLITARKNLNEQDRLNSKLLSANKLIEELESVVRDLSFDNRELRRQILSVIPLQNLNKKENNE